MSRLTSYGKDRVVTVELVSKDFRCGGMGCVYEVLCVSACVYMCLMSCVHPFVCMYVCVLVCAQPACYNVCT